MCTVLLPPGVNPITVNKYIIYIYHISYFRFVVDDQTEEKPHTITCLRTRAFVFMTTLGINTHENNSCFQHQHQRSREVAVFLPLSNSFSTHASLSQNSFYVSTLHRYTWCCLSHVLIFKMVIPGKQSALGNTKCTREHVCVKFLLCFGPWNTYPKYARLFQKHPV